MALRLPAGSSATIVTPSAIARAATGKSTADFSVRERSITTESRSATLVLANGNKTVSVTNKAATLTLDGNDLPVTGVVTTTTVLRSTTTASAPSSSAVTTTIANQTAGTTVTTTAPATTSAPTTTVAQTTTTTNPVNFTQSFRNGGASGYWNSCSSEILDLTVTGATTVTSVTASIGTSMFSAMNSSGNDWTFYSMPTKTPGTYSMTVTVNASNGVRTKTLSIVYDNDCIQGN